MENGKQKRERLKERVWEKLKERAKGNFHPKNPPHQFPNF